MINFLENSFQETTNQLEAQIKGAADKAESIITRFMSEQLRSKLFTDDAALNSLRHQLKRVREDITSSIVENINNIACALLSGKDSVEIPDSSPPSSRQMPLTNEELFIGFQDVFGELNRLVIGESSAGLRVVSIVGMGGMGKTTIARKFFNQNPTSELFEVRGWVTVSKDFSARDILLSLMASIQPFIRHPKQANESIENHVHKNLKGRRFLIVLDDVWTPEELRLLMRIFPDDNNGSRILLTTRQREVAVEANPKEPTHIVKMRFLDKAESCSLLLHKVFHLEECPSEFQHRLNVIASYCKGLPLVIVLVGGILSVMVTSLRVWDYICKMLILNHQCSEDEMVDWILSMSYMFLPHHLRSCLFYMGAFPEDYEVNISMLTKQLLAQDFLRKPSAASSSSSASESYDVEECLHELVKRNLVSIVKRKFDGIIKSVCLHDMVRDFYLEKAQQVEFLQCVTDKDFNQDTTRTKIKVTSNLDNLKHICISDCYVLWARSEFTNFHGKV